MSLELLRQNAPLISAFAAVGSFFIWSIYAVLFYSGFRRQRSSHLFIHAAGDGGPQTECLIINLSPEPVHVLCSLATSRDVSVQLQASADQDLPIHARAKQGPLQTGEYMSLGSFELLMKQIDSLGKRDGEDDPEQPLEVKVAAIHGLSDQPIGASRSFLFNRTTSSAIPDMAHTEQKRSRRESRQIRKWMAACRSYRETEEANEAQ